MKLINLFVRWGILLCVLSFAACSDDDDNVLRLPSNSFFIDASGGDCLVALGVSSDKWEANPLDGDKDWFTLSKQSGSLKVSAPANTSKSVKKIKIEVKANGVTAYVDVAQGLMAESGDVNLNDESISFDCNGGQYNVSLPKGMAWRAVSDAEWCKIEEDHKFNALTIYADINDGESALTATVSVMSGAGLTQVVKKINVVQYTVAEQPYLSLIGDWELYSNKWLYDNKVYEEGAGADLTISGAYLNETYVISGLIFQDMEIPLYYNPEDGTVSLPLGWDPILVDDNFRFYLAKVNQAVTSVESGTLVTGVVSEDRNTVNFVDFGLGYGMGIIGVDYGGQSAKFSNLPYAIGDRIEFRRIVTRSNYVECYGPMLDSGKRRTTLMNGLQKASLVKEPAARIR